MDNVQMLIPIDPKDFWKKLREIIEDVVLEQKKKTPVDWRTKRPLLKIKEVCEIFQISRPTIYDWLRQGRLKSVKIRSRRYFHWEDVEDLIQHHRSDPTQGKQASFRNRV